MFKYIGMGLLLVIAVILVVAATRPDTFRMERSIVINAPPDKVFAILSDFHQWTEWSPWEKLDPAMTRKYSGPSSGKGAVYAWQGNSQVGEGQCAITEVFPSSKILMQLDYVKPFKAHNLVEFRLQPSSTGTQVTWALSGRNNYVAKLMSMLFTERMLGKMFDQGLMNLKTLAEQPAQ